MYHQKQRIVQLEPITLLIHPFVRDLDLVKFSLTETNSFLILNKGPLDHSNLSILEIHTQI